MMDNYTKPQPVVVYGAIVAGLTTTLATLTVLFKDNPGVVLGLGVAGAIVGGASVVKDQLVKAMVTPQSDVAAYRNAGGDIVTGPAAGSINPGAPAVVAEAGKLVVGDVAGVVIDQANQFDQPSNTNFGELLEEGNPLAESEKEGNL